VRPFGACRQPAASGTRELSATVAACSGGRQVQPVVGGVCAAYMFCTRAPIGTQLVSSNASATQRIVLSILVSLRAGGCDRVPFVSPPAH